MKNMKQANHLHRARERRLKTILLIVAISTILAAFTFGEEVDVVAYALYTEAEGESFYGKQAVASVIQNAARQKRRSYVEEVWTAGRYQGVAKMRPERVAPQWFVNAEMNHVKKLTARAQCYYLAGMMLNGDFHPVGPWNMFHSGKEPWWLKLCTKTRTIGGHTFGYLKNL